MKRFASVLMLMVACSTGAEEKITFDDGSVYKGQVKEGKIHGKGTLTFADGAKYIGMFSDGVFEGYGLLTDINGLVSEGTFRKGKLNGIGVLKFSKGDKYIGEFKDGLRSGNGRMIWADGNTFDGEWKNDTINGKGVIRRKGLHVYAGKFTDGKYDGQGVKVFENGDIFQGIHRAQWPLSGTYVYANGDTYEGEFKGNMMDGKGVMVFSNGAKYEGDFVKGALTGKGTMTFLDGSKCEGDFVGGDIQGKGVFTSADGQKSSVVFKGGQIVNTASQTPAGPIFLRPVGISRDRKTALIVFMHGSGSSPEECEPVFAPLVDAWNCSVLYPRGSQKSGVFPNGNGAYDWDASKDVDAVIEAIKNLEGIDPKRVFLTGFSSGAVMTYRVAFRAPGMFAGVIPFSGFVPGEYLTATNPLALSPKVPFYIFSGDKDNAVTPGNAKKAESYLKKLGTPVKVNIFDGTHYLPENIFDVLKEAIEWFDQSSNLHPRQ